LSAAGPQQLLNLQRRQACLLVQTTLIPVGVGSAVSPNRVYADDCPVTVSLEHLYFIDMQQNVEKLLRDQILFSVPIDHPNHQAHPPFPLVDLDRKAYLWRNASGTHYSKKNIGNESKSTGNAWVCKHFYE
jgi:hypothetical protein